MFTCAQAPRPRCSLASRWSGNQNCTIKAIVGASQLTLPTARTFPCPRLGLCPPHGVPVAGPHPPLAACPAAVAAAGTVPSSPVPAPPLLIGVERYVCPPPPPPAMVLRWCCREEEGKRSRPWAGAGHTVAWKPPPTELCVTELAWRRGEGCEGPSGASWWAVALPGPGAWGLCVEDAEEEREEVGGRAGAGGGGGKPDASAMKSGATSYCCEGAEGQGETCSPYSGKLAVCRAFWNRIESVPSAVSRALVHAPGLWSCCGVWGSCRCPGCCDACRCGWGCDPWVGVWPGKRGGEATWRTM